MSIEMTPQELVDHILPKWMKSEEAVKLDFANALKMDVEDRVEALAKAFLNRFISTQDKAWTSEEKEAILNGAWDAIDKMFNNPSVYGEGEVFV